MALSVVTGSAFVITSLLQVLPTAVVATCAENFLGICDDNDDVFLSVAESAQKAAFSTFASFRAFGARQASRISALFSRQVPEEEISTSDVSVAKPEVKIMCHITYGFGDIKGCIDIGNFFNRSIPEVNARLVFDEESREKVFSFDPVIARSAEYYRSYGEFCAKSHARLFVDYPINAMKEVEGKDSFMAIAEDERPHLGLMEYGLEQTQAVVFRMYLQQMENRQVQIFSLGGGENELGFMFNEELYLASQIAGSQSMSYRLSLLERLPVHISEAILGQPYSPQAVDAFIQRNELLYSGYSSDSYAKDAMVEVFVDFTEIIRPKADLTFVLLGVKITALTDRFLTVAAEHQLLFQRLKALGVKQIKLLTQSPGDATKFETRTIKFEGAPVRNVANRVRIVSIDRLPHRHMLTLFQASERSKVTTGDHSPIEVFSMGGIPLLELFEFKRDHARSLIRIANGVDDQLGQIAERLFYNFQAVNITRYPKTGEFAYNRNTIVQASFALERLHGMMDVWDRFIQELRAHSCWPPLERIVRERLAL